MGEGLLQANVKESLESIITECFSINRILDRMASVLDITLVMPNTGNIVHHNFAHLYPQIADLVSNYMIDRNSTVIYGETLRAEQLYDGIIDCFDTMLKLNLSLENKVKEAMISASDDYTTKAFLEEFMRIIIPITADILLLIDKANMYGDSKINLMKFDKDILDFPFKGEM